MVNNDISNHLCIIRMHAVDKFNQFALGSPSRVLVAVLRLVITRSAFRFTRRWKPYHIEIQTYIRTILQQCGPLGITNLSCTANYHITRSFIVVRIVVERLQHYVRTTLRNRSWVTWSLRWNIRLLVTCYLHTNLAVEGNSYVCFLIHFEEHIAIGIARYAICATTEIQGLCSPVRSPCSIRDFESIFASRKVVIRNRVIYQFAGILTPIFATAPCRTCYAISGNIVSLFRIKRIGTSLTRTNINQIAFCCAQFDVEIIFSCYRASKFALAFTTFEIRIRTIRIQIYHPCGVTTLVNQFNLISHSKINT